MMHWTVQAVEDVWRIVARCWLGNAVSKFLGARSHSSSDTPCAAV